MTSHLTALGYLTKNQKDEANRLNISHMDYRDVVLQNLADENEERVRKNNNKVVVECKNPVIIVGHGPDWEKEADKIKGTKIPIIATDVCSIPLMDMGIIPTYIATYEEAYKRINEKLFDFDRIDKYDIQVVGSNVTREWMDLALDDHGMTLYRYDKYKAYTISNVGIFTCKFAKEILEADRIILIGMNCWDSNHGNPYLNWYVDWRRYIEEMPDGFFINCTQGGVLYIGKIIECNFSNLVVKIG